MSERFFIFKLLLLIIFLHFSQLSISQNNKALIYGKITDIKNDNVQYANVAIVDMNIGTVTAANGYYELKVPSGQKLTITISYQGSTKKIYQPALNTGEKKKLDVTLDINLNLTPFEVKTNGNKEEKVFIQKIDPKVLDLLPSSNEKIMTIIKTLPGVSSNNEMTSNYSVRGGNYDENLVYINDIEIYRPILIRSGQEEGLPIVNSDLVQSIKFSAGGFEAKYGDKMSSVLDITYKQPSQFAGNVSLSILGQSAHIEGASKNKKFTYMIGVREHSNSYLLSSLDVKGEYKSSFTDVQSYFTYNISPKLKLSYLSYYGNNNYSLQPQSQETTYGSFSLVLKLDVYFDGQQVYNYQSFLNALNLQYKVNENTMLKFIASAYNSTEKEDYDVQAQYWLSQVDINQSSPTYQKTIMNLGVGTYLDHARDDLTANIYSFQHLGAHTGENSELQWGVKVQAEQIIDNVRDWKLVDSADYSIPANPNQLTLNSFLLANHTINSVRYNGFVQDAIKIWDKSSTYITAGVRASYWDYTNEFIATPRVQLSFMPFKKQTLNKISLNPSDTSLKKNILLRAAIGMYYQPAFYPELISSNGVLNPDIRSQKSYQVLVGGDMYIKLWNKPFKLTTEVYYKYLTDIIPYDVDDIRVVYFGRNDGVGYTYGLDMQLYGELLKDLPSWISVSLMKSMENLSDNPGWIPRPTDQLFRVSLFFQDYIPQNPDWKVHLNAVYGSPLPYGPPGYPELRDQSRMPSYKRIDIGFSKLLLSNQVNKKRKMKALNYIKDLWLTAEVYNLFGFQNVISYFWVKDVNNNLWGVPNYLTSRRFNISLMAKF